MVVKSGFVKESNASLQGKLWHLHIMIFEKE